MGSRDLIHLLFIPVSAPLLVQRICSVDSTDLSPAQLILSTHYTFITRRLNISCQLLLLLTLRISIEFNGAANLLMNETQIHLLNKNKIGGVVQSTLHMPDFPSGGQRHRIEYSVKERLLCILVLPVL